MAVQPVAGDVTPVTQTNQPGTAKCQTAKLISVQQQKPFAIGGSVSVAVFYPNTVNLRAGKVAQSLVMIARNVDDLRASSGLMEDCLNNAVICFRPMIPGFHVPQIENDSDEIQVVGFGMEEEVEQELRMGGFRSKMNV